MVLLKKLSIATAGGTAILCVLSGPVFAFTLAQLSGDSFDPLGNLPSSATGTVSLNPWFVGYLAPPTDQAEIFTRFRAEAPNQFPNWTVERGPSLGGEVTIKEYNARDYVAEPGGGLSTPRGGVNMTAIYDIGTTTDLKIENLRFIQLFTDNTGTNGTLVNHIDKYPDHMLPWYYSDTEHTQRSKATAMLFEDAPSDKVTSIPFNRTVRFETYLATFNNTTKVATIHDGWSWGYQVLAGEPVPEPLTILGSVMGLGFGAFFKIKVSRKCKKNA